MMIVIHYLVNTYCDIVGGKYRQMCSNYDIECDYYSCSSVIPISTPLNYSNRTSVFRILSTPLRCHSSQVHE